MKFLPTENIIYQTKLKEDEIISRLAGCVEPRKMIRLRLFNNKPTKPYEGEINCLTFSIRRIINYRNSFLPKINGVITQDIKETSIKVKMRLHSFVYVFLIIFCAIAGYGCFIFLDRAFNKPGFDPKIFIPFGMLIFIFFMTLGAFKYESRRSKKDLQELFEAETTIITS